MLVIRTSVTLDLPGLEGALLGLDGYNPPLCVREGRNDTLPLSFRSELAEQATGRDTGSYLHLVAGLNP